MLGISTFGSRKMEERVRDVVKVELNDLEGKNRVIMESYVVDEICQIYNGNLESIQQD